MCAAQSQLPPPDLAVAPAAWLTIHGGPVACRWRACIAISGGIGPRLRVVAGSQGRRWAFWWQPGQHTGQGQKTPRRPAFWAFVRYLIDNVIKCVYTLPMIITLQPVPPGNDGMNHQRMIAGHTRPKCPPVGDCLAQPKQKRLIDIDQALLFSCQGRSGNSQIQPYPIRLLALAGAIVDGQAPAIATAAAVHTAKVFDMKTVDQGAVGKHSVTPM